MKQIICLLLLMPMLCTMTFAQSILDGMGLDSTISQEETNYTCTPLPPSKPPAQHSSAEGIPPLPLPAVPLRRTEKKNPPRPPVLIAKVATANRGDWATNPSDVDNLLRWMASNLNTHFSSINIPVSRIPSGVNEVPILYRTGHDAFEFSDEVREQIRQYLLRGGTMIFDSCCGRRDFFLSAYREAQQLIPERPPYRLGLDHPIYHSFFDINRIGYRPWALKAGAENNVPSALGIDIGCRTAVFIFRWDLSCGWDNLPDSDRHHCLGYDIETAKRMGANLMAYITAERSTSTPLSQALEFVDADRTSSGKFIIGQVRYSSIWKTREAGLSMLLNAFYEQTRTPVRFARTEIDLDSPRIFDLPFLYMTGHNSFELSDTERRNLSEYIGRGGVLFAEACCGRSSFDQSFCVEIRKTFGRDLERIHDPVLFNYPNRITLVSPRPALAKALEANGPIRPVFYGLKGSGTYNLIYSPYGLSCGWELAQCPYCRGIQNNDAIAVGINILSYAILQ